MSILTFIVVISTLLRWVETRGLHLETYLETKKVLAEVLGLPWWRWFLPIPIGGEQYRLSTSGLGLTTLLDMMWGTRATFLVLHAVFVAVLGLVSFQMTRSYMFSITTTLAMAFGTHFTHYYVNTSCIVLPIFLTYIVLNLWSIKELLWSEKRRPGFELLFIISLLLIVYCWEMWLDYWCVLIAISTLAWLHSRKNKQRLFIGSLRLIATTSVAAFIFFLLIKLPFAASHLSPGDEGELLIGYFVHPGFDSTLGYKSTFLGSASLFLEDLVTNFITYIYLPISSHLPAFLLGSWSIFWLGRDGVIASQSGHYANFISLSYYHHLFSWYLAAGIMFCLFVALTAWTLHHLKKNNEDKYRLLILFLIMIIFGSATHVLIKFRAPLATPLLVYKSIIGALGVGFVIAWAIDRLVHSYTQKTARIICIVVWTILISNGFLRPVVLNGLAGQVGIERGPDPIRIIQNLLHF